MRIGDEVYIHGYVDEIRKDVVVIRNEGGYFGTVPGEVAIHPEPEWIPVELELPNGREEVIVSVHDDMGDTPYDYTTCGWMIQDNEIWIVDNEQNDYVVAWMHLPKPFKSKRGHK